MKRTGFDYSVTSLTFNGALGTWQLRWWSGKLHSSPHCDTATNLAGVIRPPLTRLLKACLEDL